VVRSRAAEPVDHQEWVGAVMDTARREVGVRDAAWSEIERACRGNIRFTFPGSRPGPERAEVFARTAVLEEYAKWLAGEAAAVHRDGSVTLNSEVVATLAALPPDSFEQSWPQMTQPALAMFLRCGACLDDQSEDDSDIAGWLADLHAFGRSRFSRCGCLAVAATIDSMIDSPYAGSAIEADLQRSGLPAAVAGSSDLFDTAYRNAEAPRPSTDDVADLVTALAAVGAWLDARFERRRPAAAADDGPAGMARP
jgi:hypothetical protein